jgi:type IV pilus assembly protein PilE
VRITRDHRVTNEARLSLKVGGFTLLELMIVVTVITILAAIALPAYQDQLRKGRRAAAQAFLVDVASRQQQYLLDARGYAVGGGAIAALNLTVPPEVAPFYTVAVSPAAATVPPTYQLQATPIAASAQAPDGTLTLDQDGARTRAGNPGW